MQHVQRTFDAIPWSRSLETVLAHSTRQKPVVMSSYRVYVPFASVDGSRLWVGLY